MEYSEAFVRIWALAQCGVSSATGLLCFLPRLVGVESIDRPFFYCQNREGWKVL